MRCIRLPPQSRARGSPPQSRAQGNSPPAEVSLLRLKRNGAMVLAVRCVDTKNTLMQHSRTWLCKALGCNSRHMHQERDVGTLLEHQALRKQYESKGADFHHIGQVVAGPLKDCRRRQDHDLFTRRFSRDSCVSFDEYHSGLEKIPSERQSSIQPRVM